MVSVAKIDETIILARRRARAEEIFMSKYYHDRVIEPGRFFDFDDPMKTKFIKKPIERLKLT